LLIDIYINRLSSRLMKPCYRYLILLFLLITSAQDFVLAQEAGYITGRIIDSTKHEPLEFATVMLKHNQIGVITNTEGDFRLSIRQEFTQDTIVISCIGFKHLEIAFGDLLKDEINNIELPQAIYSIGEVQVYAPDKSLNSLRLVRRAIRRIPQNYPCERNNYIAYYRDYQKREGEYLNLNEAIIQTLDNGFKRLSIDNSYRMLSYKKNSKFKRVSLPDYYDQISIPGYNSGNKTIPGALLGDQFGNELFVLMVHDAIRNYKVNSFSFVNIFDQDFIKNHTFMDPIPILNNELMLLKIDFTTSYRVHLHSLHVKGSIFIQPEDYSIHKLIYTCGYTINNDIFKPIYTIDVEYGYEQRLDSLLGLKYISFNNVFQVVDSTDEDYFKIEESYWKSPYDARDQTMVFVFNREIDAKTARKKQNYQLLLRGNALHIADLIVDGNTVMIRPRKVVALDDRSEITINMNNIKDIQGNHLNVKSYDEYYQYRELFVQDYNPDMLIEESCFLEQAPLEENCISTTESELHYWMNTPLKSER
jgi:hypothetical protein